MNNRVFPAREAPSQARNHPLIVEL